MQKIKVIHQGLGPIGRETARFVLQDKELEIVGAVDTRKELIGKDLGELLGMDSIGVPVSSDIETVLIDAPDPKVLVLATTSLLSEAEKQINIAFWNNINVVSCCEQLFYPEFTDREAARRIDGLAKSRKMRVIGTGINPGCLMDAYPLKVIRERIVGKISLVEICRTDDTSERRAPLLKKTGAGLTAEKFYGLSSIGSIGHMGLQMSVVYLAEALKDRLGIERYEIKFLREPIVAKEPVETKNYGTIEPGYVVGLHESCIVVADEAHKIRLDLSLYAGAKNRNSVSIDGKEMVNHDNFVNGDIATARILKEAVRNIYHSFPGLNRARYVPDMETLLVK